MNYACFYQKHLPERHHQLSRALCRLAIGLLWLAFVQQPLHAATYYLDATHGDDTNLGTTNAPWRTLAQAQTAVQAGDIILLRSGNYGLFEQEDFSYDGWVTYQADGDSTPVLDGIALSNPTPANAYLTFDGITIQVPDPNPWPNPLPAESMYPKTANPITATGAHHLEINNCILRGANKYLTMFMVRLDRCDHVTLYHNDMSVTHRGITTTDCDDVKIRYNHIHGMGAGSGISVQVSDLSEGEPAGILVEGNHIHEQVSNSSDDYYPYDFHGGSGIAVKIDNVHITKNVIHHGFGQGIMTYFAEIPDLEYRNLLIENNLIYDVRQKAISLHNVDATDEGAVVVRNNTVIGPVKTDLDADGSYTAITRYGANSFNVATAEYGEPGSTTFNGSGLNDGEFQREYRTRQAFAIRCEITQLNVDGYDRFKWYVDTGNGWRLAEENAKCRMGETLIDESTYPWTFYGTIDFSHTTGHTIGDQWSTSYTVYKAKSTGVQIYNNIIVDEFSLPDPDDPTINGYQEDYNIFWRYHDGEGYQRNTPGSHSLAVMWQDELTRLRGYPMYFENLTDLSSNNRWTIDFPQGSSYGGFFVDPDFYTNHFNDAFAAGIGRLGDYHFAPGSPGINFGDPAHQPSDSLGSIGPDGFIRPDGAARDTSCHSAGCYEYRGPIFQQIDDKEVENEQVLAFTVAATHPDGAPITYSASGPPFNLGATFSGQTFNWNTSGVQPGRYEVTFVATAGQDENRQTVAITVLGDNQAPVLGSIGGKSATEGVSLGFSVSGSDGDGDTLSYSASGLPSGATFSGQSFSWTPASGQAGSYQVTFAVSDGLVSDSETITITVQTLASTNTPPVLAAIGNRSVNEAAFLAFPVSATDADGDSITYSANNLPSGANFVGQSFSWVPTSAQVGSHQITFAASDGRSQDFETVTVNVVSIGLDKVAPVVARRSPAADAIQVTLNHLVTLHVTDSGRGVDADTVVIQVDNQTIYQGDTDAYTSAYGRCSRSGVKSDYRFIYQPNELFDFDEVVTVKVNAGDLEGNVMSPYSYSFVTEMRAFGNNWAVGADVTAGKGKPATASNTSGDIWAAWHAGTDGDRDIYVSRLDAGADSFGSATRLTTSLLDQCNPDVAVGADGSVYVAWQDNSRGNWDIYFSRSTDGIAWTHPVQVTDSNDNEANPAITVDSQSPNRVYVAWQDDRNGHYDIYVASSVSDFVNDTVSRVMTQAADQTDPDVAVDVRNTVYVVWTDMRDGQANVYGAASDSGPWANVPIVTAPGNQTDAAVAVAPGGSVLHVLWADDRPGNSDIYYARSEGLPGSPVTGGTIIDDTSRADQLAPAIVCSGDDQAYACWQDFRHAINGLDSDLFLAELRSGSAKTNVLIGDDSTNANQSQPAVGIDKYANPYVVWTDDRNAADEIYYAATTFVDPVPLGSKLVTSAAGATVGPDPQYINGPEDVSIIVPAGACQTNMQVTIAEILNPQALPVECLGSFDLGPSGIQFDQPVTVTIPYRFAGAGGSAVPYWYDGLTGALSQQGITDIENLVISSDLNALQFKTTHFTPFYLVASDTGTSTAGGGGGGGGGCSVSATGNGAPQELLVPYGIVALVMVVLRCRDKKRRRSMPTAE